MSGFDETCGCIIGLEHTCEIWSTCEEHGHDRDQNGRCRDCGDTEDDEDYYAD